MSEGSSIFSGTTTFWPFFKSFVILCTYKMDVFFFLNFMLILASVKMMYFCAETTNKMGHWSGFGQWEVRDVVCIDFPGIVRRDGISLLYNCHQESYLASHADTQRHLVLLHTVCGEWGEQQFVSTLSFQIVFKIFPGVLFIFTQTHQWMVRPKIH